MTKAQRAVLREARKIAQAARTYPCFPCKRIWFKQDATGVLQRDFTEFAGGYSWATDLVRAVERMER